VKKEKWTIDIPDEKTIKSQIDLIVTRGISKPKAFHAYLSEMYQQLGFRYLFRDATEILFVILLTFSVFVFGIFPIAESKVQIGTLYSYLFVLSPILYMLIASIFVVNVYKRDTFEVEMTCKYHVF